MKTVLITGSSRGIGRETAIYFAQQGWNVIIHGFRHPEKLESLKNEILEENVSCLSFCGDISDPSFVDEMIKQSLLTFSKIDCLVNNAGISLVGLFTDATVDDWNLMINTNLTSVLQPVKISFPICFITMRERSSIFLPSGEMPALPVRFYILQQKVVSMLLQRLWQKRLLQAIFR